MPLACVAHICQKIQLWSLEARVTSYACNCTLRARTPIYTSGYFLQTGDDYKCLVKVSIKRTLRNLYSDSKKCIKRLAEFNKSSSSQVESIRNGLIKIVIKLVEFDMKICRY